MAAPNEQGLKTNTDLYNLAWYGITALSISGVIVLSYTDSPAGWLVLGLTVAVFGISTLITAWQTMTAGIAQPEGGRLTIPIGGAVFFSTLILASEIIPSSVTIPFIGRLVLLVTGTQALFIPISVRDSVSVPFARQVVVPVAGHLLVGLGSFALILSAFVIPETRVFQGVILWYAAGLSLLALNTFWMGQETNEITPPPPNSVSGYWEQVLLSAIIIGTFCLIGIVITSLNRPLTFTVASLGQPWIFTTVTERAAATVVGITTIIGFASLAAPRSAPDLIKQLDRTGITIGLHALTAILLLNTVLLGLFFLIPSTFLLVFGVLLALVTLAVLIDYIRIAYAHRHRNKANADTEELLDGLSSVTAVIPAYNEADILADTIEQNLAALDELQLLLVPAAGSTDKTVEVAETYRDRYPDRINLVEGVTGSKAGDLNQAWSTIATHYVLLLDADEIANFDFVSQSIELLEQNKDVGIVQARKIPRLPSENWLSRFVSAERRVETWINHQFVHDIYDASHFAGSAAVLRHHVPEEIDGWSTQALTEDIDLTIRLYLETEWTVRYVSQLAISNLTPSTISNLIRQRRRWARGWVEVTWRYTRDLIDSRQKLGWRQTLGLLWELFSTIGAPIYLISVGVTLFVLAGSGPVVPLLLAVVLAIFLLPARGFVFAYTAYRDPLDPIPRTVGKAVEVVIFAYLWILFLWIIQLHVLYLQLAGAEKEWEVTTKS